MIVLFKNIPNDTYHNDITGIIQPVIQGGLFKPRGYINNIDIIALRESDTGPLEFQALVQIEPDRSAAQVIKKLHGMTMRGNRLTVRQYFLRSWKNDKRSEEAQTNWQRQEKRTTLSRRRNLKTYKICVPEYQ